MFRLLIVSVIRVVNRLMLSCAFSKLRMIFKADRLTMYIYLVKEMGFVAIEDKVWDFFLGRVVAGNSVNLCSLFHHDVGVHAEVILFPLWLSPRI